MRSITIGAATLAAFTLIVLLSGFSTPATAADEAGSVTGTVTGKDGQPAVNCTVALAKKGAEQNKAPGSGPGDAPSMRVSNGVSVIELQAKPRVSALRAKTDQSGKYTINKVPPGDYYYTAGNKNVGMARGETHVNAGQALTLDMKLADMPAAAPKGK